MQNINIQEVVFSSADSGLFYRKILDQWDLHSFKTYQLTQWSHAIVNRSRTNAMVIHVDTMLLRILLYICSLHTFLLLCKLEKNRTNAQSLIAEFTIAIETNDRRPWWWLLTFVLLGCDIKVFIHYWMPQCIHLESTVLCWLKQKRFWMKYHLFTSALTLSCSLIRDPIGDWWERLSTPQYST